MGKMGDEMEMETVTGLFGVAVAVQATDTTAVARVADTTVDVWVREAIGRIVRQPIAEYAVVAQCGRVAAVRIVPVVVRDPVVPLALCEMPDCYWWAMAEFWDKLLSHIRGWPLARKATLRMLRIVEETMAASRLTADERYFAGAHLWGAFLGEANARAHNGD